LSTTGATYGLEPQYVPYENEIEYAANTWGIDPDVLAALLEHEAGILPDGSPAPANAWGAAGSGQFIPATAKTYGVDVTDNNSGIVGAAQYLSDLLKGANGNLWQALASYNEGAAGFARDHGAATAGPGIPSAGQYASTIISNASQFSLPGGSAGNGASGSGTIGGTASASTTQDVPWWGGFGVHTGNSLIDSFWGNDTTGDSPFAFPGGGGAGSGPNPALLWAVAIGAVLILVGIVLLASHDSSEDPQPSARPVIVPV
jgi:Transglycosylase SLT domain